MAAVDGVAGARVASALGTDVAVGSWAGAGVGVGGSCFCSTGFKAGAFKPAYCQPLPWHALFEQKELLSVPPALAVV